MRGILATALALIPGDGGSAVAAGGGLGSLLAVVLPTAVDPGGDGLIGGAGRLVQARSATVRAMPIRPLTEPTLHPVETRAVIRKDRADEEDRHACERMKEEEDANRGEEDGEGEEGTEEIQAGAVFGAAGQ